MKWLVLAMFSAAIATPALAHVGVGTHGFSGGLAHPFSGLDHLLAAFTVGLWAATTDSKRIWLLPLTFVVAMTLSTLAGAEGLQLPFVEPAIALSVLVLGLLVALIVKVNTGVAVALIAVFALVHGDAHGAEGGASFSYLTGLIAATAILHACGVTLGLLALRIDRPQLARAAGGVIAMAGVYLLVAA